MPMNLSTSPSDATAPQSPLLRSWRVDYGPPEVLTQFVIMADTICRAHGVTLEYGTFEELLETNCQNRDSWFPLNSMFDYRNGMLTPETAFCVLARNERGDVIGTHAARLYDWRGTTLKAEARTLSMNYPDPETMKRPGEQLLVDTPRDAAITGRCAFSGAAWIHPSYRNRGLSAVFPKIAKATAFTRYSPDIIFGLMTEAVFKNGFASRFDYPNVDFEVRMVNGQMGTFRMAVVWMEGLHLIGSLEDWIARESSVNDTINRARQA